MIGCAWTLNLHVSKMAAEGKPPISLDCCIWHVIKKTAINDIYDQVVSQHIGMCWSICSWKSNMAAKKGFLAIIFELNELGMQTWCLFYDF